jgi:16S rRNA (adenine1518-N6/adenine1519-N6)-dimethyltransferase
MQTKHQIRDLLSLAGIQPNKRLGQHFLIDLNLMRLLIDSANIRKDDIVLEVGCGTGSMTEALAEKAGRIIAVELDRNLYEITRKRLSDAENLKKKLAFPSDFTFCLGIWLISSKSTTKSTTVF